MKEKIEKEQSESKLQGRLEQYLYIVENSLDGIIILQQGIVKYCNHAVVDLSGYKLEELINKKFEEFLPPEYRELIKKRYQGRLEGKDIPSLYEIEFIKKDGTLVPVEVNNTTINYYGEIATLSFVRKIAKRKSVEQELLKERALLKGIIDNIPVLLTRYDPEANMLYLNKEFEKVVGWKTEEVRDLDMMKEVYPDPDYRKEALEYMQKASAEWREFEVVSKSGKIIHSEWSNIRLDDGTQIGIGIDINERKKAEETLRESEKKFCSFFKSIPMPTYTWKKEGDDYVLSDWNKAAESFTNGKIADIKGIKVSELYKDDPQVIIDFNQCFLQKSTIEHERYFQLKTTGENKYLNVRYVFVHPDLIMIHTDDITERKNAEEEILRLKDGLEQQVAEKTKELNEKVDHLQRFFDATVDRELRMKQLSDENDKLKDELKKKGGNFNE